MEPFRKKFESDPFFPFIIVFKEAKTTENELAEHLHDWNELVYVYKGAGSFFIDQTIYEMRRGDLFIIPGNTIHRAFPDKENPVTSTAIFFNPTLVLQAALGDSFTYLKGFEQCRSHKNYRMDLSSELRIQFEMSMEQIQSEIPGQKSGYRHAILLILQQILLQLNRSLEQKHSHHVKTADTTMLSTVKTGSHWMNPILLYIDQHLTDDIGLASLSVRASITASHFSRVFRQLTGMNLTHYITTKRIISAKELLINTDHSISCVAEQSGFLSLPHFHRMFKKVAGTTPATFKKAYRIND